MYDDPLPSRRSKVALSRPHRILGEESEIGDAFSYMDEEIPTKCRSRELQQILTQLKKIKCNAIFYSCRLSNGYGCFRLKRSTNLVVRNRRLMEGRLFLIGAI
jgi:hypothetical protein